MATIKSIVLNEKGSAGSNGSWKVFRSSANHRSEYVVLTHYGVPMLRWIPGGPDRVLWVGPGYGTVSDQGGVNTALRVLSGRQRYYFSRMGGATLLLDGAPVPWGWQIPDA